MKKKYKEKVEITTEQANEALEGGFSTLSINSSNLLSFFKSSSA